MNTSRRFLSFVGSVAVTAAATYGLSLVGDLIYTSPSLAKAPAVTFAAAAPAAAQPAVQTADAASTAPAAQTAAGAPDAAAGKSVFSKCKSCHTIDANGKNGMGPNLYGVVNRPIASVAGFAYSDAMKGKASGTWTPADLDTYLADVKGTVPGTKMSFAGLANAADRANLIAFLAQNSATPIAAADLGLPGAAAAAPAAAAPAADAAAAPAEAAPAIVYSDPPAQSDAEKAEIAKTVTALEATLSGMDYQRARYHALHFKPAIDKASNEECLACHKEVLGTNVRDASPAGLANTASMAWYQTLATYDGAQATFHQRHMTTPYAQAVMNLKCTFCHQGNDPREEAPQMTVAPADMTSNNGSEPFTLRKMVNPSETCLRCHGAMPDPEKIMGLPGKWPDIRKDMETADAPNGCLTCHGETIRTNRHNVTYLNAATIEDLAKESSDVCYGCHGGRQWYRISYPYPRHAWPGMDPAVPDWAKDRKTESDPRYARQPAQQ